MQLELHALGAETTSGHGAPVNLLGMEDFTAVVNCSAIGGGALGSVTPTKTGSAIFAVSGAFTGSASKSYVVVIDGVGGGAEVGQATFKWSEDGGSTWAATGVLTSHTPILLSHGVSVAWTTGAGADFVLNDQWAFNATFDTTLTIYFDLSADGTNWKIGFTGLGSPLSAAGVDTCQFNAPGEVFIRPGWLFAGTNPSATFGITLCANRKPM